MPRIPDTRVRTSHALTIKANGITVGLINGWNPTASRTVTPVFEVGTDDSGNPVENIPGNATGLTVSISRYDLYATRLEEAFGTPDIVMLTRQTDPFEMVERWALPSDDAREARDLISNLQQGGVTVTPPSIFTDEERFLYRGCWFTNIGRTIRSDDNRIINVNATIMYTRKLKITGLASALSFGLL